MANRRSDIPEFLWYSGTRLNLLLAPLSGLFAVASKLRRSLYRRGVLRSHRVAVPVVVVGNISVGGTGKTPVTLWLATELRRRGFNPGIASRGYGGIAGKTPVQVNAGSDPAIVGDEPLLMAQRGKLPVVVHPDRAAAARELVRLGADVVIADDGLQHYRLHRDYEIAVMDAERGHGNGWLLPAGPLREPPARLREVDRLLLQTRSRAARWPDSKECPTANASSFHLAIRDCRRVRGTGQRSLVQFRGNPVHAVAGIGNPERFFSSLEDAGLEVIRHSFPDHAQFKASDVAFDDSLDVIMTEKDAVKCREFASDKHWFAPVDVEVHDTGWLDGLVRVLKKPEPPE